MASRSLGTLTLDLIAKIGGFEQGMDRASRSVTSTATAATKASAQVQVLERQFSSLAGVAASIAGPLAAAFSAKGIYDMTEAYGTLTNRLKLVTNGSAELATAQAAVFGIAQDARQPLTATAELYQRIATNQTALKLSGEGVAGVVGTISKTLAISGASAESANAALVQLGQAFASGTLRGEELNSVLEQAPALAQAIAAGMGVAVGDLKSLGEQGKITAASVVKALQAQAGAVDAQFSKMTATIGGSLTVVGNSLTHFVGELDQATGTSGKFANEILSASKVIDGSLPGALKGIQNNSDALSQAMTVGLYVALARVSAGFTQQGAAALSAAVANRTAMTAAAATAKGDLLAAQSKQIDAKALLYRANLEVTSAQGKVASDRARQASELANAKTVQLSISAERLLEQQRLAAQINNVGRAASVARLAELRLAEVGMIKQVEVAERSLAATTVATSAQIKAAYVMRTAAATAYAETSVAANALAATSRAASDAAAASGLAARAFGTLATAGRGLLALMGGPVGLVFIAGAAALAFTDFRTSSEKAAQGLEGLKGPLDEVIAKFRTLTQDQKAASLIKWGEAEAEGIKAANEEYSKLQNMLKVGLVGPRSSATGAELFQDYSKQLNDAKASGQSLSPILEKLKNDASADPKLVDALVKQAGAYSVVKESADEAAKRISALNGEMGKGASGTAAATMATTGLTAAGQKYLKTQQDQLGKLQDNNDAVKEANRYLDAHKELSEADRAAILSTAYATNIQTAANKDATAETKKNTSEIKANQKVFETAQENYQRQIELLNTTADKQNNATEAEKLAFEMSSGKYAGLGEARKKELQGLAAELDAKKALLVASKDAIKLDAFSSTLKQGDQTAQDGYDLALAGAGKGDKYKQRLKETLEIRQDFDKQMRDLQKQQNSGEITPKLYEDETTALQESLAKRLISQQDYFNQVDEAQSQWMDGVSSAWQNYVDDAENYSQQAADFVSGSLSDLTGNLGDAFASIADGSKNIGDAFADMAGNMANSVLKALSDMAAQWLVYQAVQMLVGKTTQASAIPLLVANATATSFQAGLAAFASTAAIPIVGPAAAPAAMAAALAATSPMVAAVSSAALSGMAHDGMSSIPKEGTWLLDGGERIVTPEQNKDLTQFLNQSGNSQASTSAPQISISAPITVQAQQGVSDQDAQRQGQQMSQAFTAEVVRILQGEMNQGGVLWRK